MPQFYSCSLESDATGVADGSTASSGMVGEVIQNVVSTALGSGFTDGQFGNITSIDLTAGDWMIYGKVDATFLALLTKITMTLSSFSGNTTTDHVVGDNLADVPIGISGGDNGSCSIGQWHQAISSTTTYFLKAKLVGAVGNILTGRITAIRIR